LELEQRLPGQGRFRLEMPVSYSTLSAAPALDEVALAPRAEWTMPLGGSGATLRGRFTRTDRAFSNLFGQQTIPGQMQMALGLDLAPSASSQLRFDVTREINDTGRVDNSRSTGAVEFAHRFGQGLRLSAGLASRLFTDSLINRQIQSGIATVGAEISIKSRFELSARREQNITAEADPTYPTQTVLGSRLRLSAAHALVYSQRISPAPIIPAGDVAAGGLFVPLSTSEISAGMESRLGGHTSLLSRYSVEQRAQGTDAYAVVGLLSRLPLSRMVSIDGGIDHAQHVSGPGTSYSSIAAGLTVMPHANLRGSAFYQVRLRESAQHMLWSGVAGQITPWLSAMGQFRLAQTDGMAAGPTRTKDGTAAFAIRPPTTDRVGILLSYEYGERIGGSLVTTQQVRSKLSVDGFLQPFRRLELYGRVARVDAPAVSTLPAERGLLWQARGQWRVLWRFDVAAETRYLEATPRGGASLTALESGFWVTSQLRFGVGYSSAPLLPAGPVVTVPTGNGGYYLVLSTRLTRLFSLFDRPAPEQ
jgi:hypothetical protein